MKTSNVKISNIFPFTIVLIAVFTIIQFPKAGDFVIKFLNNNYFWWAINIILLYYSFTAQKYFCDKFQKKMMVGVQFYLLWNVFTVLRGFFIAETYWDWKNLLNCGMALMLPIVSYGATDKLLLKSIFKSYVKYGLPLFGIIFFLTTKDAYGYYLIPITFLLIFHPIIKRPWNWIVLFFSVFSILADFTARSNVIKFGVPLSLSFLYYFRFLLSNGVFDLIRKLLFLSPVIFLYLAVSFDFNIFKMNEYFADEYVVARTDDKGQIVEDNLLDDTRTFIYLEALTTAEVYNSWLMGRTPARGNISLAFGDYDLNNRGERYWNEMAIANIFNWSGLIGILFYFLALYRASYLAVNVSNNYFCRIMGVFLAFHWMYSWVENVNIFNLTTFTIWILVGFCYSSSFRKMNNDELKLWVNNIFYFKKNILN